MNKLKMLAVTAIAAASVGTGALVTAPSASAMTNECARAMAVAKAYDTYADICVGWEWYAEAAIWMAKANAVRAFACGF